MSKQLRALAREYADGTITADQLNQLEELLRNDAEARDVYLQELNLITGLEDLSLDTAGQSLEDVVKKDPWGHRRQSILWSGVAVTAAAILIGFGLFWQTPTNAEIGSLTALNGQVRWTGNDGRLNDSPSLGMPLPGGTLELLTADAWATFEFTDGSIVTLAGESEAVISEQARKELHLRNGRLSADIVQQTAQQPMLVRTSSAELEVLGTQFNVAAQNVATTLAVNKGRVRLKRITDGREVEVQANQSVTASLENQNDLPLNERIAPASVWTSDLQADVVKGKWLSNLWVYGAQLKNKIKQGELTEEEASAAYKKAASLDKATGSVWAMPTEFGALVVLSPARSAEEPIQITEKTRIRVQGRSHTRKPFAVGFSTYRPDGGFSGKYQTQITVAELKDGEGYFDLDLPIKRFQNDTAQASSPLGNELVDWWCVSSSSSDKIEITAVEARVESEPATP